MKTASGENLPFRPTGQGVRKNPGTGPLGQERQVCPRLRTFAGGCPDSIDTGGAVHFLQSVSMGKDVSVAHSLIELS